MRRPQSYRITCSTPEPAFCIEATTQALCQTSPYEQHIESEWVCTTLRAQGAPPRYSECTNARYRPYKMLSACNAPSRMNRKVRGVATGISRPARSRDSTRREWPNRKIHAARVACGATKHSRADAPEAPQRAPVTGCGSDPARVRARQDAAAFVYGLAQLLDRLRAVHGKRMGWGVVTAPIKPRNPYTSPSGPEASRPARHCGPWASHDQGGAIPGRRRV